MVTLLVFHFDKSGSFINDLQLENNENNINCWEDEETNLNKSFEFYGDNGIDEYNNTFINNIS